MLVKLFCGFISCGSGSFAIMASLFCLYAEATSAGIFRIVQNVPLQAAKYEPNWFALFIASLAMWFGIMSLASGIKLLFAAQDCCEKSCTDSGNKS